MKEKRGCPSLVGGRPAKPYYIEKSTLDIVNHDKTQTLVIPWSNYREWVYSKYAKSYAVTIWSYSRKYFPLIANNRVRELDLLKDTIKNNVIKSLTVLSKYLGIHEHFKQNLKSYGITTIRQNAINSFLRILRASNSDLIDRYKNAFEILRSHEQIFLRFLALTGIRKIEAINSFNLIIELHKENKLDEYYDRRLECLCHFKYPKLFLRNTKNVFISFVNEDFVSEITVNKQITYDQISKKLYRKGLKVRLDELRDYYGTYLLKHGILEQEVNLLQGRIPPSIFIKHYWSPNLKELRDRVFEALKQLEQKL